MLSNGNLTMVDPSCHLRKWYLFDTDFFILLTSTPHLSNKRELFGGRRIPAPAYQPKRKSARFFPGMPWRVYSAVLYARKGGSCVGCLVVKRLTSANSGAESMMVTLCPSVCKARAAAKPPKPAPTMRMFLLIVASGMFVFPSPYQCMQRWVYISTTKPTREISFKFVQSRYC